MHTCKDIKLWHAVIYHSKWFGLQFTTVMWGQWGKLTMIVSKINESSVFQSSHLFVLCNPEFPWKIPEQTKVWHKWYVHVSLSYLSKLKSPLLSFPSRRERCVLLSDIRAYCGLWVFANMTEYSEDKEGGMRHWWQMSFPLWNTAFLKWSFKYNESEWGFG